MALIAKIMVAAMVDGKRREFQPGEEVTGLHEHDVEQLTKMGAIEDTAAVAAAKKAAAAAQAKAAKEFATVKEAQNAAKDSTAAGAAEPPQGDA